MTTTPEQLKLHKFISYAKSGLRIAACAEGMCAYLLTNHLDLLVAAFFLLGVAEILGIIEEMVVE